MIQPRMLQNISTSLKTAIDTIAVQLNLDLNNQTQLYEILAYLKENSPEVFDSDNLADQFILLILNK